MRVAVFIDGANFYYCQKTVLGWKVEPKKLVDYIQRHIGNVISQNYYITVDPESEQFLGMERFSHALRKHMGFNVTSKNIKIRERGDQLIRKASVEVDLVTDLAFTINDYDMAIIVSSNGEYIKPIARLIRAGKKCIVINSRDLISQKLIHLIGAKNFIDFNDIRQDVERIAA